MFDANAVSQLTSGATAGWATFAIVLVALIRAWPAIKAKVTEARAGEATIADRQYKKVLAWCEKMEARVVALEEEVENCHRERDEALARAIRAEAASEGIGQIRTAQAIADAEQRRAGRDKKGAGE